MTSSIFFIFFQLVPFTHLVRLSAAGAISQSFTDYLAFSFVSCFLPRMLRQLKQLFFFFFCNQLLASAPSANQKMSELGTLHSNMVKDEILQKK